MTEIRCPLAESAMISKHEPAILTQDRCILYSELDEMVSLAASRLKKIGCKEGDRVALLLKPDLPYLVLLLALMRIGAVACPLNTYLPTETILTLLQSIACQRLITSGKISADQLDILDPNDLTRWGGDFEPFEWNQKMTLERPATIIFTSGSSGTPKAVLHTYGNHYYSARGANANIRVASHDKWLLTLPLYHVGGLGILFRCLLSGATVALMSPDEKIEEAQARHGATHLSLVSTQLYRLLKNKAWSASFAQLKAVLLGGGSVNPMLLKEGYDRKLPMYTSYGSTEMASQITAMQIDSPPQKRLTSGKLLRYREVRLDADGKIFVRGPTRFAGYVECDKTIEPFDDEGWFATGDLGQLDSEGYLTVLGRKDHMFISGGENIQPEKIERILMSFPEVEEAVVVPVPDEEFGHRPVAFLKERSQLPSNEELLKRLETLLPRYEIPISFLPWQESSGIKISRARLVLIAEKQKQV